MEQSLEQYLNRKKELYMSNGVTEEDWETDKIIIMAGNIVGLKEEQIDYFVDPKWNNKQRIVLLFVLFSNICNIEEFLDDEAMESWEMIRKLKYLVKKEALGETDEIMDAVVALDKNIRDLEDMSKEMTALIAAPLSHLYYQCESENKRLSRDLVEMRDKWSHDKSVINDLENKLEEQKELFKQQQKENEKIIEERVLKNKNKWMNETLDMAIDMVKKELADCKEEELKNLYKYIKELEEELNNNTKYRIDLEEELAKYKNGWLKNIINGIKQRLR